MRIIITTLKVLCKWSIKVESVDSGGEHLGAFDFCIVRDLEVSEIWIDSFYRKGQPSWSSFFVFWGPQKLRNLWFRTVHLTGSLRFKKTIHRACVCRFSMNGGGVSSTPVYLLFIYFRLLILLLSVTSVSNLPSPS